MFTIIYRDNCEFFQFGKKSFTSLDEAINYCEEQVKGDQPYNWGDTPDINNHYHLEVYSGNPVEDEPDYRTGEFYKEI